jgi:hypothetical protein
LVSDRSRSFTGHSIGWTVEHFAGIVRFDQPTPGKPAPNPFAHLLG